jgi:two-component system chemotaxis response regulator CheB
VILTGMLEDGSAGLVAIARCGGTPIVQDPDDAEFDPMPRAAIANVPSARRVALDEAGALLVQLAQSA